MFLVPQNEGLLCGLEVTKQRILIEKLGNKYKFLTMHWQFCSTSKIIGNYLKCFPCDIQ